MTFARPQATLSVSEFRFSFPIEPALVSFIVVWFWFNRYMFVYRWWLRHFFEWSSCCGLRGPHHDWTQANAHVFSCIWSSELYLLFIFLVFNGKVAHSGMGYDIFEIFSWSEGISHLKLKQKFLSKIINIYF